MISVQYSAHTKLILLYRQLDISAFSLFREIVTISNIESTSDSHDAKAKSCWDYKGKLIRKHA